MFFINYKTLLRQNKTLQLIDKILSDDRVAVHSDWACSTLLTHLSPRFLFPHGRDADNLMKYLQNIM